MSAPPPAPSSDLRRTVRQRLPAREAAVLLVTSVLHSLVTIGALFLAGLFLGLALLTGRAGGAAMVVLLLCALLVGVHRFLSSVLRRTDIPRPGAAAALLTASAVLVSAQTVLTAFVFDLNPFGAAPFAAAVQGAAIATVLSLTRGRAIGWAAATMCGVMLAHLLLSLGLEAFNEHQAAQRELEALATYPYEVAVLDAPGWTPVSVNTRYGEGRVVLVYENADGDGVVVTTWGGYVPESARDRPLWARCDGYAVECTRVGEVVLREGDTGMREPDEARLEVLPGRVAVLEQRKEAIPGTLRGHTLPGIGLDDLHRLTEYVRVAEDGELQEIAKRDRP